ncbi:MepB family protein [Marinilongibacter aquaticus]|uniref:MepB family protein n=1 Tax=Marinilongibacter aquaticus TaxID=2975157 RepID=UPI0021BDC23D|nr:MepB family protein [Marinilongibacter aquaticus]UBM59980.1 MepB family protein [Marinilongibacter aquaticus]
MEMYILNRNLQEIKTKIYDKLSFELSDIENESEGTAYDACRFALNGLKIISRSAKTTPKKVGQFVTFWKRNTKGLTEPYAEKDRFDFYIIQVKSGNRFGQFVFPKSELINKGLVASEKKEGKRGFRVYPIWDGNLNPQAQKTQAWQLQYFYEIDDSTDLQNVQALYSPKEKAAA